LVFVLAVAAYVAAQDRKEYHMVNVPGTLESILLSNPVPLVRHELGSLTPPGTVKMFAIVASDPDSKRAAKGLEVQLEGDDVLNNRHCKDTVYIDEDGLADFEDRLAKQVEWEERLTPSDSTLVTTPVVVQAANTASGKPPRDGVFYVPVEFGSYWSGTRFGVYVMAPHSQPTTGPHRGAQFRLPNANISDVLRLVREGRQWLQSNPPNSAVLKEGD
jgi:hypothetical protein